MIMPKRNGRKHLIHSKTNFQFPKITKDDDNNEDNDVYSSQTMKTENNTASSQIQNKFKYEFNKSNSSNSNNKPNLPTSNIKTLKTL